MEDDVLDIGRVVYEIVVGRPMRDPRIPDDFASYSEAVVRLLRDILNVAEGRMLPAEAAARARDLGAEPGAPIVNISDSAAAGTAEHAALTDDPAPDIERAVEKLTTGIDAGGAYSAVLAALERDPPSASRSLFKCLFNCPIASDPLCTIRSLTMLHNIMLDGPSAVLDAARGNDKFLDWVESTWTQEAIAAAAAADDPGAESPHPASNCFAGGDLAFYTSFLRRKARFHMLAAGGFSGAWERTNVTAADGRDVLHTRRRKVVGGMADLAEMASEIGVRFATATDSESSLKHASLRAIVDECGRAFTAAHNLASETQSVRDAEKLVPGIARLWDACRALLHAVRGIRSAGADDWAESFAADSPPDIVQEAELRIRGVEIADDMPKSGWEETEKMIGNVDGNDGDSKEKKKKKKKEKAEVAPTASPVAEDEVKPGEFSAGDGALVVHGEGDAAAAAVTTLFGDLLKMDGGDTSHLRDVPYDALNARVPGELTDGEALASAFGAPPPSATPALGYDDDDDDGGYDNFRARQQEARVSASTGAWAARAGYGGGALVVHHSAEVAPNKPHPVFCQCALCAQAEAQNAAMQADGRARDGYSDSAYGVNGQHETSRDDSYRNGYDSPGARNGNGNSNGAQEYHDDAGSYESISYSVDEEHEYQPRERKAASKTMGYGSSPPSRHSGSTVPPGQPPFELGASGREAGPPVLRAEFAVNLKKLRTGDKLGEGAFGVVYKGEYKRETVAIKKMNKKMLGSKNAMAEFCNEVHTMCSLSHPGVLKCIAAGLTPPNVLLVTEFMKRGTLFDVLYKQHIKLTWSMIRKIALQVAEGLAHLQERNIVHRDVKASNILVDGAYNAKLGDFGLAGPPGPSSAAGVSGTYQYMAPEILSGAPHSSKSRCIRIWSGTFGNDFWVSAVFRLGPHGSCSASYEPECPPAYSVALPTPLCEYNSVVLGRRAGQQTRVYGNC